MKREHAESDLHFLGFIVFENKLKEGTAPAIHALRAAHLACRMVTGDNVRTAISVARECGLVSHSASVYIPSFVTGKSPPSPSKRARLAHSCSRPPADPTLGEDAEVEWTSVDDDNHKLEPFSLKPIVAPQNFGYESADVQQPDYQLALTGDVFRWMLDYAPLETMQRVSWLPNSNFSRIALTS